jgi:hypothetical protein
VRGCDSCERYRHTNRGCTLGDSGRDVDEILGGHMVNLSLPLRRLPHVVAFRLSRGTSEPIRPGNLAYILDLASIQQIRQVNDERAVLPFNLDKSSLNVTLDFDPRTTRKCSRVGGTKWDGDDRAEEGIRAVHRVMRLHASHHAAMPVCGPYQKPSKQPRTPAA